MMELTILHSRDAHMFWPGKIILCNTTKNGSKQKVSDMKKMTAQFWAWEEIIYRQQSELEEGSLSNRENQFCA